jgi:hypothetical protein
VERAIETLSAENARLRELLGIRAATADSQAPASVPTPAIRGATPFGDGDVAQLPQVHRHGVDNRRPAGLPAENGTMGDPSSLHLDSLPVLGPIAVAADVVARALAVDLVLRIAG